MKGLWNKSESGNLKLINVWKANLHNWIITSTIESYSIFCNCICINHEILRFLQIFLKHCSSSCYCLKNSTAFLSKFWLLTEHKNIVFLFPKSLPAVIILFRFPVVYRNSGLCSVSAFSLYYFVNLRNPDDVCSLLCVIS